MRDEDKIKLFGMQNLILESDLLELEASGIDIGHMQAIKKEDVVDTEVFEIDIRNQAKQMMGVYYLLFCLENSVRKSVSSRLKEKYGATWWESKVPEKVKVKVKQRQKDEKDTPFSERSNEPIYYSDFLDLINIIEENWPDFSDTFRSIESIKSTLGTLNVLRRGIAHNSVLEEDEIQRFKLHIKDWVRIQM
ncbi:Swt1 family HEPN domain-containing protein [Patescibacteria group bacterium]